jgi:hypothetical protein
VLLLVLAAPPALAQEPSGCDKFKWPIERDRAALTAPDRDLLASGNELAALPSSGNTLLLVPPADAELPMPPERAPKEGTLAGFIRFKNPPRAGLFASLSAGGWLDVVQDGHVLKPKAFSGATD